MAPKTNEGSVETAPGVSCPANAPIHTATPIQPQHNCDITFRRLPSLGPVRLLGGSRVVVETRPDRVIVDMDHKPWGWPCQRREFFNRHGKALKQYCDLLNKRLEVAALQEDARRARIATARQQEANARLNGRRK